MTSNQTPKKYRRSKGSQRPLTSRASVHLLACALTIVVLCRISRKSQSHWPNSPKRIGNFTGQTSAKKPLKLWEMLLSKLRVSFSGHKQAIQIVYGRLQLCYWCGVGTRESHGRTCAVLDFWSFSGPLRDQKNLLSQKILIYLLSVLILPCKPRN